MAQAGVRMSAVHMHLLAVHLNPLDAWVLHLANAMPMSAVNDRCLAKIIACVCNGQIMRK